ncbi:MAG: tRNA-dihydrouridine synthase family protein [Deltaproteobacteria bacterium]|nr:tRNA-dihydrouridine synthase family protein [Deltaproteobacteria bacterium]
MEGFTTFPMRLWLAMTSRPMAMTTPFLRVTRTHPDGHLPLLFAPELFELRGMMPYELTPQLITGDIDLFMQTEALLPPEVAAAIELNCGCPSPSCVGHQAGSGILRDPARFGRTIAKLAQHLGPGRLAVKMRLGVDDAAEFGQLVQVIADLPLARLTVHGRTRADRYRGHARWDLIEYAASATATQTWASGDVCGIETADEIRSVAPTIKGVMIGRGLLRNPWVFDEIRSRMHQEINLIAFANALLCYALLHEISIKAPEKLIAKILRGRLLHYCGTSDQAWEHMTAELTAMVAHVPLVFDRYGGIGDIALSNTAFGRLRILWSYLRSSLPEPFHTPKIMRAKNMRDFFAAIFIAADEMVRAPLMLRHQPTWDDLFGGVRGSAT